MSGVDRRLKALERAGGNDVATPDEERLHVVITHPETGVPVMIGGKKLRLLPEGEREKLLRSVERNGGIFLPDNGRDGHAD